MKYLVVLFFLFLAPQAHAAFTESFDTYTNGANLDTLNGGTGWAGAWTKGSEPFAAAFTISNTQSVSSPNSMAMSSTIFTTSQTYQRQFGSAISSGTFYLSWRTNGTQTNVKNINLANASGGNNIILQHNNSGNVLQYYNGSGYTTLFTFTNDTWYRIGIQIDAVGNANKARYDVSSNGGSEGDIVAWTAYSSANGTWADINYLTLYNPASANLDYIDNISDTYIYPVAASTPVTILAALLSVRWW